MSIGVAECVDAVDDHGPGRLAVSSSQSGHRVPCFGSFLGLGMLLIALGECLGLPVEVAGDAEDADKGEW